MASLWNGEFREDGRYGFAVGQIRVLQSRLLESSQLGDLADSLDIEELLSRLAGTVYAPSGETAGISEQFEANLRHLRWAAYELVLSHSADQALERFIQGPEDFRNIKILLRRRLIENSPELELSDLGFIPPAELEELLEAEKYEALSTEMSAAIAGAITAYYQQKNPRNIDMAIDRGAMFYRQTQARQLKNEYFLGLCSLLADLSNIRSLARIKWLHEDPKLLVQAYLPGGAVELSRLQAAMNSNWENMPPIFFFASEYAGLVEHGMTSLATEESFLHLERYCDDYITEYLRASNQVAAGPEPLVAYLMSVEQEIRSIRLIFSTKQAGLESQTIRDRLAVSYAG